jgi:heme oxygenase (biliverdin-IX-beta and delta-forming)
MASQTASPPQTIRWSLRDATADLHEAVDRLGSGFDLGEKEGYRRFLRAHARALPGLERAIEAAGIATLVPDWPARSRRAALMADLAALGEAPPPAPPAALPPGLEAALGATYVLEGSRFGNGMLLRQIANSPHAAGATAYLSHKAGWPAFLERLEAHLSSPAAQSAAAEGARAAFHHFHAALSDEAAQGHALHV